MRHGKLLRFTVDLHGRRGNQAGLRRNLRVTPILASKKRKQVQAVGQGDGARDQQHNQQAHQHGGKPPDGARAGVPVNRRRNAPAPELVGAQAGEPAVDPFLQILFIKHHTNPPNGL